MAIEVKKDGRAYVIYRKDGKRVSEYMGSGPAAARKAEARNLALGYGKRKKDQSPAFGACARAYARQKQFSENSRKHFEIRVSVNLLPFFGAKIVTSLTDRDINDYIAKRRTAPVYAYHTDPSKRKILRHGVKWSTIRRELNDFKAILNYAAQTRPPLIPFNPVRDFKIPKSDDAIIDPPTVKEVKRILVHAPEYLQRAIKLSFFLGLRPGSVELLSLTWDRVNFETESIRVISADKGGPPIRDVPVHPALLPELKAWFLEDGQSGPLVYYNSRAVKSIGKVWGKTLKKARITRRLRPYDLRHYFITETLRQGHSIKTVAEVVGSAPETIMRYYQHVTKKDHRDLVESIPDLGLTKQKKVTSKKRKVNN